MAEIAYATEEMLNTQIGIIKNNMAFEKEITDMRFQSEVAKNKKFKII